MSHFPGFQSDTPYVILPGASIPDIDGITSSERGEEGYGVRKFKKHLRILSIYLIPYGLWGSYNLLIVLLGSIPAAQLVVNPVLHTVHRKYKKSMQR